MGDWSFKLRSYVSVVDLQLGRIMEAVELAAHASVWIPSEPLNQDMDAQLRYLLVMLTSGPALQIIRQQPSGAQAFRDLARRGYNPRSQARSLAQLQEIMHFDFSPFPRTRKEPKKSGMRRTRRSPTAEPLSRNLDVLPSEKADIPYFERRMRWREDS